MNISIFIARRLTHGDKESRNLSGPAVKVATAAVALSVSSIFTGSVLA